EEGSGHDGGLSGLRAALEERLLAQASSAEAGDDGEHAQEKRRRKGNEPEEGGRGAAGEKEGCCGARGRIMQLVARDPDLFRSGYSLGLLVAPGDMCDGGSYALVCPRSAMRPATNEPACLA